jgi:hypothetical protein
MRIVAEESRERKVLSVGDGSDGVSDVDVSKKAEARVCGSTVKFVSAILN